MSYAEWKDKTAAFKQIDVRGIQGNFFQGIKRQAMQTPTGGGLEIIQSFDPIPLYEVMDPHCRADCTGSPDSCSGKRSR